MWEQILKLQPKRKTPNLDAWANDIRLMRERDGRTDDEIRELFTWANQDSFWQTNILCPQKLREKWDDLDLKRSKSRGIQRNPAANNGSRVDGDEYAQRFQGK